jgi:hypothetical protein
MTNVQEAAARLGRQRAKTLSSFHQSKAAKALAAKMTPKQRSERASKAARARWKKGLKLPFSPATRQEPT